MYGPFQVASVVGESFIITTSSSSGLPLLLLSLSVKNVNIF
jgi:hypothetical protein